MDRVQTDPAEKYQRFSRIALDDRRWPSREITAPPAWCSVDLRDGNQALITPMDLERKLLLFETLVAMGFKEIEIGFPSASQVEFDFTRRLIEQNLVPHDVTIQVLSSCRQEHIVRTFEALRGARRAILHIYNSTSPIQRRLVFRKDRHQIISIAARATQTVREEAARCDGTEIVLEYSPESFSATEVEFSLAICEQVVEVWRPDSLHKMIVNLPATVEMATPNVFADQIEWFARHLASREAVILSVHPHNDRGTAVAAAELAIMAGADRVEGTLFGNGERTGNVDLVTMALNLWTQGIHPGLDLSDINRIRRTAEVCTRLPVHPRHPYVGDLVFTAFSGSHQDAIGKVLRHRKRSNSMVWEVPYLPLDPVDIGRTYDGTIRINSQSGKGGVAYTLEEAFGVVLPHGLQIEFARVVQGHTEKTGEEIDVPQLWALFEDTYLTSPVKRALNGFRRLDAGEVSAVEASAVNQVGWVSVAFHLFGHSFEAVGAGDDVLTAFLDGLWRSFACQVRIINFETTVNERDGIRRHLACLELVEPSGRSCYGVGRNICAVSASLEAVVSALSRLQPSLLRTADTGDAAGLRVAAGSLF
jgi:2-isopropylmalate synthase